MNVGYLAPEGSYSHIAAREFRPSASHMGYNSFFELFSALKEEKCDFIAVPIENSLNGGVLENYDLLQSENAVAVEEKIICIDHRLATIEGADLKEINRIYSHPQALAQCALYLARNFPKAELVASPSTAASLGLIHSKREAGIVGAHTKKAGFVLSPCNIADEAENYTHFLLVKKGNLPLGAHSEKVFFSATCPHRPGELLNLLETIKNGGLNMTKIESRPIKSRHGEYRFFIEVEGDISGGATQEALEKIKKKSASFKLLGAY